MSAHGFEVPFGADTVPSSTQWVMLGRVYMVLAFLFLSFLHGKERQRSSGRLRYPMGKQRRTLRSHVLMSWVLILAISSLRIQAREFIRIES